MSKIHKRGTVGVHANLTPMIDVTFLLIVFFVLVSQIVEVENVELRLPELGDPVTELPGEEQRSVVNVVPGFGGAAVEYRLGTNAFPADEAGLESLTQHLARRLELNPSLTVNLRADRFTHYEYVQPVLQAVATAAARVDGGRLVPRVNMVIVRQDRR